ncbi:MAG: hypothetical protein HZB51_10385 [Chloroflexi bacterium]|nr:hypothetical protein [Chloroflexota bacterium]
MTAIVNRFSIDAKTCILFLVGPLLIGAISVVSWVTVGGGVLRPPQRIELVLPLGTAERIKAGEAVPSIPAKSVFVQGDVLAIVNQDVVNHELGPFWIPANTTLNVPLDKAQSYSYLCTIHPSGSVGLEVRPRDSLLMTLIPTVVMGVPMGIALVIIARVLSRLDVG